MLFARSSGTADWPQYVPSRLGHRSSRVPGSLSVAETGWPADSVLELLARQAVPAHRIGIEVTESVLADEDIAVQELCHLRDAGVQVAIDDFGTGYSSLSRLNSLPVSLLKIDRSFVSEIETPFGYATVDVVVRLARTLGVETVAEGVETPRQLELLREVGVDLASGFFLGRPAAAQAGAPRIVQG